MESQGRTKAEVRLAGLDANRKLMELREMASGSFDQMRSEARIHKWIGSNRSDRREVRSDGGGLRLEYRPREERRREGLPAALQQA